jgi:hypothetical protein
MSKNARAASTLNPLLNAMAIGDGVLFLPFFTTPGALHLRGVCRELRALVTNFAWDDRDPESRVAARPGAVTLWRACFPRAVACTLAQAPDKHGIVRANVAIFDHDLELLRGLRYLDMSACRRLTDEGFSHLTGTETLGFFLGESQ